MSETETVTRVPDIELINIPLTDIEFGERFRREYKDLPILAKSLKEKGIIQPIAVKHQEGEKPFKLLAGGRRFSAAAFAKFTTIPARVFPDTLDALEQREIELTENLDREDLDWREEVTLREAIHKLFVAKYGEAAGPSAGQSAADTAEYLKISPMTMSRDRTLAHALVDHRTELEGAKSKGDALNVLKRITRQDEAKKIAKQLDTLLTNDNDGRLQRTIINGYYVQDFFECVKHVPDGARTFIEIDPPYGIDLQAIKHSTGNALTREALDEYEDVKIADYPDFLERLFHECVRIMMWNTWMICWFAHQHYELVLEKMRIAGLEPCILPAFWVKSGMSGQTHHPEKRLGSLIEPFIYARKGDAIIRKPGRSNIFEYAVVPSTRKVHPTERPIEMLEDILQTFAPPGAHICVPFLGSGNTLLANANLGGTGFGCDLSEEYKLDFIKRVTERKPREYKSYA